MIHHRCPDCGQVLSNSPEAAGMTIACLHCRSPITVPREGNVAAREAVGLAALGELRSDASRSSEPVLDRIARFLRVPGPDGASSPLRVRQRVGLVVMGLFLGGLFGGGALGWVIYSLVQCRASLNWPSAPGKVERSGVFEKIDRTAQGRRMVEHSAAVVYQYTVQGKEYTSSRLAFGPEQTYASTAKSEAARYRPEQEVAVYYDPTDPKNAVLERRLLFGTYIWGVLGASFGFAGLRMLCVGLTPTLASAGSRWLPWAHRLTWPDLILGVVGVITLMFWLPMMLGL
jgi:hypothetical protein